MKRLLSLLLILILLTGCGAQLTTVVELTENPSGPDGAGLSSAPVTAGNPVDSEKPGDSADLGDGDTTFGDEIKDTGAYDGYFEGESGEITVKCLSGTENAYTLVGSTLTFTAVNEATSYAVSGNFKGNIVINVGETYQFELELSGLSLVSDKTSPIVVLSGDEVSIKAKKDTVNYIYDTREAVDAADITQYASAIYSAVDLALCGKGELTVVSEKNKGIRTKDDLTVKNLTLFVSCSDNALKGNDSVTLIGGTTTLIATAGDGIKTENSGLSSKGKQQGTIAVSGGTHTVYAACDGIDAAYDVVIDDAATVLNIYTDKYSNYSDEVTGNSSDVYYIRYSKNTYSYSVKYYNSDGEYVFVNAAYHSKTSGGFTSYYYYTFPKMTGYEKMQLFVYSSGMAQGQDETYEMRSDYLTPNTSNDTLALSRRGNQLSLSWTNYTTNAQSGGSRPGGTSDGNSDKSDYSTKGIKAANALTVKAGTVTIKSYDDALHAGGSQALGNGAAPAGDVTVNGGTVTVYSNDDGLHADGKLSITGGSVTVTDSYEGIEGTTVSILGGSVSVNAKDDGINATTTSGTAIEIAGGTVYINCTGDGIDSNSRTQSVGIVFSGGKTVVISNSSMNSAIDTEKGYTYTAGCVVAIMPRGGMSDEATSSGQFNTYGKSTQLVLQSGQYLVAQIDGVTVTVRMPVSITSALVVTYGDKSAVVKSAASSTASLDASGVSWG